MRTTKRFTPKVLARFEREGRGTGIYEDYLPWHRITRGDPSSRGRSHLLMWRSRLRELLSDGELVQQLFCTMLPDVDDALEQFPLALDTSAHPLSAYEPYVRRQDYPGVLALADQLGVRLATVSEGDARAPWRPTTDLLLITRAQGKRRQALALAFKPNREPLTTRKRQLLALEREYWLAREVPWLLITPDQYDSLVALTLRRIACWALADEEPMENRELACKCARSLPGHSLTTVLEAIQSHVGAMNTAQNSLWQAVWSGQLPVDLRRDWRPHEPLRIVSQLEFAALNPVASRRSGWN